MNNMNIQLSDKWRDLLAEAGIEIDGNMINLCGIKKLPMVFVKEVHETFVRNARQCEARKLFLIAAYDERGALMFELNANDNWGEEPGDVVLLDDLQDCHFLFGSSTLKNMVNIIRSKSWVPQPDPKVQDRLDHEDLLELMLGWGWGQEYWQSIRHDDSIDRSDMKFDEDWNTWIDKVLKQAKEFFDKKAEEAWGRMNYNNKKERENDHE